MTSVKAYLNFGDLRSFVSCFDDVTHHLEVVLCQTGLTNSEGIPVGKKLKFFSTSKFCASFDEEVWYLDLCTSRRIRHCELAQHWVLQQDFG